MTPTDLKACRRALGLSVEGFAALGLEFGRAIAESGRTVRRWEDGTQDIPAAVGALVAVLLRSAEARNILLHPDRQ